VQAAGRLQRRPQVAPVAALAALVVQHEAQGLALVGMQLHCEPLRLRRLGALVCLQQLHQALRAHAPAQ
jgi:hypothetical protein